MCYNLLNSPCPFQSAFLYGSQSVMQYCELLPTAVGTSSRPGRCPWPRRTSTLTTSHGVLTPQCGRTALARQKCISAATAGRPMMLALVVGLVTALLAAALL